MNELKIKGFPKSFSESDKRDFLQYFEAKETFIQPDYCIATFKNVGQAEEFMTKLHQKEVLNSRLNIQYYSGGKVVAEPVQKAIAQTNVINQLNPLMQKLVALNSQLNFSEPPNPSLKYKYPKPNREILDSICVALESVPKFYTQVLHLMNRMNLPPPFLPSHLVKTSCHVSCQTDISNGKIRDEALNSDESEIESDADHTNEKLPLVVRKKRKAPMINLNPAKRQMHETNKESSNKKISISEVFELIAVPSKIVLQLPQDLPSSTLPSTLLSTKQDDFVESTESDEQLLIDLTNKLPEDQMLLLPIFKDYSPGESSNKLYIKNLAKSVTESDLKFVYGRFVKKSIDEIEVKLMQSGRMKGQAFVTFNTPYDEEDTERGVERMIDKAIKATNGLILRDKPMVVVFGKVQKSLK